MATQGFSTMGIDVKVGESALNYVTDIGDIGAAPSELDATCMTKLCRQYLRQRCLHGGWSETQF